MEKRKPDSGWESPRGPVKIDPETRHITQTIYLREVAKDAQGRWINKEIASVPEHIRGFGHVKEAHLHKARAQLARLLKEWDNPLRIVQAA